MKVFFESYNSNIIYDIKDGITSEEYKSLNFPERYNKFHTEDLYVDKANDKANLLVFSGKVNEQPKLTNNVTFKINDSTPIGNLNVKVHGKTYDSWVTNYVGAFIYQGYVIQSNDIGVYKDDILQFEYDTEDNNHVKIQPYPAVDSRRNILSVYGRPLNYNVANWAVHYNELISIENTGNNDRKISFMISPSLDSTYAIVPYYDGLTCKGHGVTTCNKYLIDFTPKFINTPDKEVSDIVVWQIIVPSQSKITVPAYITLGGMSNGLIKKYVHVDA